MLKPAILFKEEISKKFYSMYYTEQMMYETGSLDNWNPKIEECPDSSNVQYAIVGNGSNLIGFISYVVDWYSDSVSRFGLISFDNGNIIIGKDVHNLLEYLVSRHHRVEWRMVGGNPVERSYDRFCKKHNGTKHVLKDAIKDRDGKYHDDIIYEIVKVGHTE